MEATILEKRPEGIEGGAYGWCKICDGFVIELGRHCFNDDSHMVDHLSPQEREDLKTDEILENEWWKPDSSKRKPPEAIKKPEIKEETDKMHKRITEYRNHFGISRNTLAMAMGVSSNTLHNWEKGLCLGNSKGYKRLLKAIEDLEANPSHNWKVFWNYQEPAKEAKPRDRVQIKEPSPERVKPKMGLEESLRELVREEISALLRELAERISQ